MVRGNLFVFIVMCRFATPVAVQAADDAKPSAETLAAAQEALQKLSEFIGQWDNGGSGTWDGKKANWKETWSWAWAFAKSGEPSMNCKVKDAKFFSEATIKPDLKAKAYTATVKTANGDEHEFTGQLDKRGALVLERIEAKSGDVHKLKISTAAEGIRLNVTYDVQVGGKGLPGTLYKSNGNKAGESLAGNTKKNACIVTGGAATITVTHNGKTYFVCCSGCADAFKDDPEKFIKAAAAKK